MLPFNKRSLKRDKDFLDALLETVEHVRKHYPAGTQISWKKVQAIMLERFPNRKISREGLRNRYRRLTDIRVNQITKRKDDFRVGRITTEQRLLNEIRQKRPIEWLEKRLNLTRGEILGAITKLQIEGYRGVSAWDEDGVIYVHNRVRANQTVPREVKKELPRLSTTFAVVSDTHIGSIHHDAEALNKFYDMVVERGIDTVLHAGDLVDGYYPNRPTSIMEQSHVGFSNQLREVTRSYPMRDGVTTYFIIGNHDDTFIRTGFADIGEVVESVRDDMVYLGHNYGKFWLNENISVSLIHPTDGISRNFNNKIRDIIERRPAQKGDLMFIGHYHKIAMLKHQESYGYVVPSFQRQTSFMANNGLESIVGGMFVTVNLNEKGKVDSVVTELVEF